MHSEEEEDEKDDDDKDGKEDTEKDDEYSEDEHLHAVGYRGGAGLGHAAGHSRMGTRGSGLSGTAEDGRSDEM